MKYLGIMVDTKMDFFGEIRHTADKAYVEIFWIERW